MDQRNITLSVIGVCFAAAAVWAMSTVNIVGVLAAWAFGTLAGLCFASFFTPKIGTFCGNFVYTPLEYLKKAPEKIAPVKGMIEQEKYPEAIAALDEILARKPFDPAPYLLLVEVYMDRLNDKNQTAELIEKYFRNPKLKAVPENVEMLMRYSDICLEQKRPEPAITLFDSQLKVKGYSDPEWRVLGLRLEGLVAEKSKFPATS